MTTNNISWLVVGTLCISLFAACGPEGSTAPPTTGGSWSGAPDEPHSELIPGLDIWYQEGKATPEWDSKPATPDYLARAKRHREFMQGGLPLEYRHSRSPYPAATRVIIDGGRLYKPHCATCHGSTGSGDGEAGNNLTPPPAFLAYLIDRPRSVDEYLLWTISEGGVKFGSKMPAFKKTLTEQQIWQIVIYMRAGFPDIEKVGKN